MNTDGHRKNGSLVSLKQQKGEIKVVGFVIGFIFVALNS